MPSHFINDPEHWRHRAQEMRVMADGIKDPASKETMLRIAKDYDRRQKGRKNGVGARHIQTDESLTRSRPLIALGRRMASTSVRR
jgi:hypothetical protein